MKSRTLTLFSILFVLLALAPALAGEKTVGTGSLYVRTVEGLRALPVVAMQVDLEVTGILVHGTVRQSFSSDAAEAVGAVYMFPLPERAAVHGMSLRVGARTIEAAVREREDARREFAEAARSGKQASLLEQHRPNLFRMHVARIEPQETVEVTLTYVQELDAEDGRWGLVFPLTFTPRYHPSRSGKDSIGGDSAEVSAVPSGSPSSPRATISVRLDAGLPIADLRSASHEIRTEPAGSGLRVVPVTAELACDRDFLLSWSVRRADAPRATLWLEERDGERYGLLMLASPEDGSPASEGLATTTVFVLDRSGSMGGGSIRWARQALAAALERLRPEDSFGLVRFDQESETYRPEVVHADREEIAAARRWVETTDTGGGTEVLGAVRRGLDLLSSSRVPGEPRLVLITDGAVSNEAEILSELTPRFERTRLHVLGIGAAPNRWLMRKLARVGRGTSAFLPDGRDLHEEMERFLSRIDRPVLADAELSFPDGSPLEVYPERLGDLHAGEIAFVSLRLAPGRSVNGLTLAGRGDTGFRSHEIEVRERPASGTGIAVRWARARVEDLLDGLHEGRTVDEVRPAVVAVGTEFGLVTPYTSLVAVERTRSGGDPAPLLPVAAALPGGAVLPVGGTDRPLRVLVGSLCLVLASSLFLLSCWRPT